MATFFKVIFRGKAAPIVALVAGVVMLIVGLVMHQVVVWITGIGFAVIGAIVSIVALVSK